MQTPHAVIEYARKHQLPDQILDAVFSEVSRLDLEAKKYAARCIRTRQQQSQATRLTHIIEEYLPIRSASIWNATFHITVSVPGFAATSAPALASLLAHLEDEFGFEFLSYENPEHNTRSYHGKDFILTCLLEETGTCQRIISGMTEVEQYVPVKVSQPTYKFVC